MKFLQNSRKMLTALVLVLVLTVTTACGGPATTSQTGSAPNQIEQSSYAQLERGNTAGGQNFGDWVVQTGRGLVQDAYVRDNNKLGVVISPQVRPTEVRPLAKSLVQGFHKNAPNRDLTVLMYAPDKQLILTARYNAQSQQIQYQ